MLARSLHAAGAGVRLLVKGCAFDVLWRPAKGRPVDAGSTFGAEVSMPHTSRARIWTSNVWFSGSCDSEDAAARGLEATRPNSPRSTRACLSSRAMSTERRGKFRHMLLPARYLRTIASRNCITGPAPSVDAGDRSLHLRTLACGGQGFIPPRSRADMVASLLANTLAEPAAAEATPHLASSCAAEILRRNWPRGLQLARASHLTDSFKCDTDHGANLPLHPCGLPTPGADP